MSVLTLIGVQDLFLFESHLSHENKYMGNCSHSFINVYEIFICVLYDP